MTAYRIPDTTGIGHVHLKMSEPFDLTAFLKEADRARIPWTL